MGVDFTAHEIVTRVNPHTHTASTADELQDACWEAGHFKAFVICPDFLPSLAGLEPDAYYEPSGRSLDCSIGYGGYNVIRSVICKAVNGIHNEGCEFRRDDTPGFWDLTEEQAAQLPFYELINFADNEGTIGPEACANIAADFTEHWATIEPAVAKLWEGRGLPFLRAFRACFDLAAGKGAVVLS